MKKILALILALCMALALCACGAATTTPTATPAEAATTPAAGAAETAAAVAAIPVKDLKIGVICVEDENSGYDYAHISGVQAAAKSLGIPEDQIIFKYNIGEDETCYDACCDLAEQGCQLIITDSYGHQSYAQQAASEYPNVTFVSMTGDTAALSGLANFKNAFCNTYESRYVSGVVAGMKLQELINDKKLADKNYDDKGNVKIGYVGAYPYAEVVSGYTSFFLGVRSIVKNVVMDVQFTNSWYDPTAEAEAANALIADGCCIISQHADSTGAPGAVQAALDAGTVVYCVGYNVDMTSVAPTAALTSAQNNWSVYYTYALNCLLTGEEIATDWAQGYAEGAVMISKLGDSCAAGTADKVKEVETAISSGTLNVFDCSTFTVGGQPVTTYLAIDTNGDFKGDQGEAITNGVFHESTLRSAPYFALDIDGITKLN